MPRDLPTGNGSLLVNVDHTAQIRDIYWPYVGQENHTNGRVCRVGVWVNGHFAWLGETGWERELQYARDSLISSSTLTHHRLGIKLIFRDGVDFHENIFLRQCTLTNLGSSPLRVRLFFCQDLSISGTEVGDCAYYDPANQSLFHYKGKRWFACSIIKGWPGNWTQAMDQWAVGIIDGKNLEGAWRDAEDGQLSGNAVAQGRVDSVAGVHCELSPRQHTTFWYTMAVGYDHDAVCTSNKVILHKGPVVFLHRTDAYWRLWANNNHVADQALPERVTELYKRSLLTLRTQIDNNGAIIAANDYDIAQFNRDTYSYMWPRDGALVTAALIEAGYSEISRRFFDFCHRIITTDGYFLHKYNPDGSLASSWHGWYMGGSRRLPIQEDETALVLWALWRHFQRFRDVEFVKNHYRGLIIRAAEWLCAYVDQDTGLPHPSWDLWEERYGIHSWTVAATWAGLRAAAYFAEAFGENDHALRYQRAAADMKKAAATHLWDTQRQAFLRSLLHSSGGNQPDLIMDASLCGLWYFGMFDARDPHILKTMQTMQEKLMVKTPVGGMARYENDYYHQVSNDINQVPGNPWFICTLWMAQWYIACARRPEDLDPAMELIEWASDRTLPSGVMAEQVHPYDNSPLSVSPLTWSHATYVATVIEFTMKNKELCPQ